MTAPDGTLAHGRRICINIPLLERRGAVCPSRHADGAVDHAEDAALSPDRRQQVEDNPPEVAEPDSPRQLSS
jgi:hypothetical protein